MKFARAPGERAGSDAEGTLDLRQRGTEGRCESEQKAAGQGCANSEGDDTPIELDIVGSRKSSRPVRYEGRKPGPCEQDSEGATTQTEQDAFGETLADEAEAAGSEVLSGGGYGPVAG